MKGKVMIAGLCAVLLGGSALAWAEGEEAVTEKEKKPCPMPPVRAELLKKYDKDGDGKLSPEEKKIIRERIDEIKGERREEFAENHPKLDEEIKEHPRAADRAEDKIDRREDRADKREDIRDRAEDRADRAEDRWDAKHDGGKADKIEDRIDKREDIRDRNEDRRDKNEDIRDHREDKRDRAENRWDRNHGPAAKKPCPRPARHK